MSTDTGSQPQPQCSLGHRGSEVERTAFGPLGPIWSLGAQGLDGGRPTDLGGASWVAASATPDMLPECGWVIFPVAVPPGLQYWGNMIAFKNPAVLISPYKSLVRRHLENCSVIRSPHQTIEKVLLERVQHRFTRMFPELKDLPYEQRLANLKLWSLEER